MEDYVCEECDYGHDSKEKPMYLKFYDSNAPIVIRSCRPPEDGIIWHFMSAKDDRYVACKKGYPEQISCRMYYQEITCKTCRNTREWKSVKALWDEVRKGNK